MNRSPMSEESRYRIERTLGRGGMATVYLARDRELDRRVAVKVLAGNLADDESYRARFLREARLAARLAHPNVVRVFDAGDDGQGGLQIVMEYVDGATLAGELRRRGPLPPAEVAELGVQLCGALEAAHEAGLVHRDVKPQNILVARDGTAKLSDFGIARSDDSTILTEHGSVLGTAAYLAPEQARGEPVGAPADLYSLGVVLYEALTGRLPHEGSSLPELVLRREREPVRPPGEVIAAVPPALESSILHCLALRPEERPASAAALAAELAPAADAEVTAATVVSPAPLAAPRRTVPVLAAVAVALALAAVGLALAFWPGDSTRAPAAAAKRRARPATTAPAAAATIRAAAPPRATPPAAAPAPAPPPAHVAPPTPSPCAGLEATRRQLEEQKHALDGRKHATKHKGAKHALHAQRKALDAQRKEVERGRKDCR